LSEIRLPELQPGSSIMPGKVNPVLCESTMQVAARVLGNDSTVVFCGAAGGQFQLNAMMPVMVHAAIESVALLSAAARTFDASCVRGITADEASCQEKIERSLAMVTGLTPWIGYERAAALAQEAFRTGKTIRQLCEEQQLLPAETLQSALDPQRLTESG
jgi:fumarate hydratase class II